MTSACTDDFFVESTTLTPTETIDEVARSTTSAAKGPPLPSTWLRAASSFVSATRSSCVSSGP